MFIVSLCLPQWLLAPLCGAYCDRDLSIMAQKSQVAPHHHRLHLLSELPCWLISEVTLAGERRYFREEPVSPGKAARLKEEAL